LKRISTLLAAFALAASAQAASITVNFDSGGAFVQTDLGVKLSAGLPTIDGDGFVLQLGYFTLSSSADNFLGTWVPLTGEGSANTGGSIDGSSPTLHLNQTTVGDRNLEGATAGEFYLSVQFNDAVANTFTIPPSTSIVLGIRFYNATTIAGATQYNTVSNDAWHWVTPTVPEPIGGINMSLSESGLEWESIAKQGQAGTTAFKTTIPVPEPASSAFLLLGLAGLATARRRRTATV
jgi:hypothetical protein